MKKKKYLNLKNIIFGVIIFNVESNENSMNMFHNIRISIKKQVRTLKLKKLRTWKK